MGRIVASVKIDNVLDTSKSLRCDVLVDTGRFTYLEPHEREIDM